MQTRMTPNADSFYKVTYKIKPKRTINDLGLSYVHYSSCIFVTAQKMKFSIKEVTKSAGNFTIIATLLLMQMSWLFSFEKILQARFTFDPTAHFVIIFGYQPANCLSMFDHFVRLALKGLISQLIILVQSNSTPDFLVLIS